MEQLFNLLARVLATLLAPLVALWRWSRRRVHLVRLGAKFPGPTSLPLIGTVLDSWSLDTHAIYVAAMSVLRNFSPVYRYYIGPILVIASQHSADLELLLSGTKYMNKGKYYNKFLGPWLGNGLLISSGDKWHARRKLLTPAFHFRILEQFAPVFHSCGDEFVRQLRARAGAGPFDVWPLVKLLTLDVICETAMGVKVNAQTDSSSEYVNAVEETATITVDRILRPWLHPEWAFYMSSRGRRYNKCLEILHGTTDRVIRERRQELLKDCESLGDSAYSIDEIGRRRRVAFLDLLLLEERNGNMSTSDIREEVDTFMFEGHDTTASAISFTLFFLSRHQNVQEKVIEEMKSVFDWSQTLQATVQQLSLLKYLDMVIKESLRIYPPVPVVFREITEDVKLPTSGHVIPAGAMWEVGPHGLHRNEAVFPDAERFDPERFSQDECVRRSPYAYLPFSAGQRNCIGQRFAMLEMKSLLSKVLWNFRILPDPEFELKLTWKLIMKSANGIRISLQERRH